MPNPSWQFIAPNLPPCAQMTQPAMLTEQEQLLQEQLQRKHQQFEFCKLALQLQVVQPQAQMHCVPGAEEIDLRVLRSDQSDWTHPQRGVELKSRHLLVPNMHSLLHPADLSPPKGATHEGQVLLPSHLRPVLNVLIGSGQFTWGRPCCSRAGNGL